MADPMAEMKAKKPALDITLAPESSDDATTDEDEGAEDSSAAAGEVFDALKTDDRESFITALKAAMLTCK